MLKPVLYYLLILTTAFRFADMIYLLSKDSTNLPIPVIVVGCAMILYGIVLAFYKFIAPIRMRQLVTFYMVQTGMIVFNLAYVALFCPLQISKAETLITGTFLDLLINAGLLYAGVRQIRRVYFPVQPMGSRRTGERSMNV